MNDYIHPNQLTAQYNAEHINPKTMTPVLPFLSDAIEILNRAVKPKPKGPTAEELRKAEISLLCKLQAAVDSCPAGDPEELYRRKLALHEERTRQGITSEKPMCPATDKRISGATVREISIDERSCLALEISAEIAGKPTAIKIVFTAELLQEFEKVKEGVLLKHRAAVTGDRRILDFA
ncbi:MAG TPA: hypothetical protein PLQ35_12175 [bacterium]|nr:hypothetical protein [bacterium]HQL63042.1 hypothetical protein [bacterium]